MIVVIKYIFLCVIKHSVVVSVTTLLYMIHENHIQATGYLAQWVALAGSHSTELLAALPL